MPLLGLLMLATRTYAALAASSFSFHHGVASGDPLPDRIILWTRVTPSAATDQLDVGVRWEVRAEGHDGTALPVASGKVATSSAQDWTVKVDAAGLAPATRYTYRFIAPDGTASPAGVFRLPAAADTHLDKLEYAIFSCANYRFGFFNAYANAARRDLDFWLHLGDFYYEYGADKYPAPSEAVREGLQPSHEAVSLEDYRLRHATYRTDESLQQLSASAPLIAIWDDHEIANDASANGAQNHGADEGRYGQRKQAAARAYREWMPVRGLSAERPYALQRSFTFGDLATLMMMETRATSRTPNSHGGGERAPLSDAPGTKGWITRQLEEAVERHPISDVVGDWGGTKLDAVLRGLKSQVEAFRNTSTRSIVGPDAIAEMRAVARESVAAGRPWQLFGQPQVVQDHWSYDAAAAVSAARKAGDSAQADHWAALLRNLTQWPLRRDRQTFAGEAVTRALTRETLVQLAAARYKIPRELEDWQSHLSERRQLVGAIRGSANAVVYGGDSHSAWVGGVRDDTNPTRVVAAEFDGMSITSPSGITTGHLPMEMLEAGLLANNDGLEWADLHHHGYMLATLSHKTQAVTYLEVGVEEAEDAAAKCLARFEVAAGSGNRVQRTRCGGL